ncbi:hypothetical protein J6590_100630 [Homalodisca vitripennis]|nr:hypothetical protein J6590_100630 [Homalodisca vitripennis]
MAPIMPSSKCDQGSLGRVNTKTILSHQFTALFRVLFKLLDVSAIFNLPVTTIFISSFLYTPVRKDLYFYRPKEVVHNKEKERQLARHFSGFTDPFTPPNSGFKVSKYK